MTDLVRRMRSRPFHFDGMAEKLWEGRGIGPAGCGRSGKCLGGRIFMPARELWTLLNRKLGRQGAKVSLR